MIQRFQTVCPDCQGEGEMIREKDRCKKCRGKKTIVERKVLHVPVDRGVPNGHKINFEGEGDQIPGVQPGDVTFEIDEKEHPRFKRRGDDLVHTAKIHLYTALAGGTIRIQHLDSEPRFLIVNLFPGEVITPGKPLFPLLQWKRANIDRRGQDDSWSRNALLSPSPPWKYVHNIRH
jgi:DnaJ family protein A protein 2